MLLMLVHDHQDDQDAWLNRLKVLVERLDPALRSKNQLANLASSAVAWKPNAEDFYTRTHPWCSPSALPAGMEDSREHAVFFNSWPKLTLSAQPWSDYEETNVVQDESMVMMM